MRALYIGLMSGTSLDGVDGVIADFNGADLQVLAHASLDMPQALRAELLSLNSTGANELHRAALAANALMRLYAQTVQALLKNTGLAPAAIRAIGAHGQTVRHRPQEFDGTGYTVQLCAPSLLAELCGISVVADFRSRDVAAGGQGAPLAPLFHRAWLGSGEASLGVLNIGGIANLTVLRPGGTSIGFDCGPGNALLDAWCQQHRHSPFDLGGAWAASGHVLPALLQEFLAEPYFALAPPKSTGRDLFHRDWLHDRLARQDPAAPVDVQATLAELTARSCTDAVWQYAPGLSELVVCGGGAFNTDLMQRLARCLPGTRVVTSDSRGLPPLQVEAAAFAWLAQQAIEGQPLPLESITGARGARVLGGIYPA